MRYHDDQPVGGYLLEYAHDLGAGLCIESSRRLISENDVRVVDERPGYGHSLHLTAGHLCRLLVYLIAKPHLLKGRYGACPSLSRRHSGKRQSKLDVGKHILM